MRRHSLNHIVRCGGYINKAQEKKIKIYRKIRQENTLRQKCELHQKNWTQLEV